MRYLVTGGAGFIGSWVCQKIQEQGDEPLILDHRGNGDGLVILGDIRDATAVTEAVAHADRVVHLAGVLGTAETIANPRPAADINITGMLNVLEACAQYRVPLVNISVGNWFEFSPYSVTKFCAERFCEVYRRHRGVKVSVVRALNAYGPGQKLPQPYGSSKVRKVIPSFVVRALAGEPLEVYGDGQQVMDMIYVEDVARILLAAFVHDNEGGIIEAGTGRPTTVLEIAQAVIAEVKAQTGAKPVIRHLPMRPGESEHAIILAEEGSTRKAGIDPAGLVSLEDGLARTVSHYRKVLSA